MLELSLLGVGTLLRLYRNARSMVKLLRQATYEYAPLPPFYGTYPSPLLTTPPPLLYGHVFRNAMLIVIAGFPAAFVHIFFTGSLLIEVIFSLDGLGLLGYESIINRDYPVVLGTLYMFALIGLLVTLIRDVVYVYVDPRISFEGNG